MLKIRLQRVGRKNDPHFRLVVLDSREGPKSGNVIETLGFKNPKTKDQKIDAERVKFSLSNGAQTSDTAYNLLVTEGVIKGKKRNPLPKKSPPIVKEKEQGDDHSETEDSSEKKEKNKDNDKNTETPDNKTAD